MSTNTSTRKDVVANSAHRVANTAQAQVANFSYNSLKKYSRWEVFADGQS